MLYEVELRYTYGWDDAEWTEEVDGITKPLRFQTIESAQMAIDEFFANVKATVAAGNMDTEACHDDYRIVEAKD